MEVLDVQSKPQLGVGSSLPIVWCCANCEFMTKVCLSLSMGYFLTRPIWKSHSTGFQISSRGNSLWAAVYSVHLKEEGRSGASQVVFLVPPHHFYVLIVFQKELEKQKRIKRNQQLEAIAKDHYERVLLRKKGLEPWKRLRMQSKQNIQVQCHTHTPQNQKIDFSNSIKLDLGVVW